MFWRLVTNSPSKSQKPANKSITVMQVFRELRFALVHLKTMEEVCTQGAAGAAALPYSQIPSNILGVTAHLRRRARRCLHDRGRLGRRAAGVPGVGRLAAQ